MCKTTTGQNVEELIKKIELPEEVLHSKIAVAMSGGVDSSTTAALLKEAGIEVLGIYMKNWSDPRDCSGSDDRADALHVASKLGIPFHVFDLEKEYKEKVINYFYEGYAQGLTPNPDVMCNKEIKFKIFLEKAMNLGADYIATGHYARVRRNIEAAKFELLSGVDPTKDQSYFLYTLGQKQLSKILFPLGNLRKTEVRKIAKELDLPVYNKKDSQGICFVGEVNIKEFLSRRLSAKPGEIVDLKGRVLGKHNGAYFYTLGQREGLGIGGGIPYYVIEKKIAENKLVVAPINQEKKLYSRALFAQDPCWVSGSEPLLPLKTYARIRHLQPLQRVTLSKAAGLIGVVFGEEQRAISPGQSVVFYENEKVLGGGIIK